MKMLVIMILKKILIFLLNRQIDRKKLIFLKHCSKKNWKISSYVYKLARSYPIYIASYFVFFLEIYPSDLNAHFKNFLCFMKEI